MSFGCGSSDLRSQRGDGVMNAAGRHPRRRLDHLLRPCRARHRPASRGNPIRSMPERQRRLCAIRSLSATTGFHSSASPPASLHRTARRLLRKARSSASVQIDKDKQPLWACIFAIVIFAAGYGRRGRAALTGQTGGACSRRLASVRRQLRRLRQTATIPRPSSWLIGLDMEDSFDADAALEERRPSA